MTEYIILTLQEPMKKIFRIEADSPTGAIRQLFRVHPDSMVASILTDEEFTLGDMIDYRDDGWRERKQIDGRWHEFTGKEWVPV